MRVFRFLVCLGLFGPAACFVPAEVGEQMQRDIAKLQADLQKAEKGLDQQSATLDEKIAEASTQIKQVNQALQDLNRAARMTDADFGIQIERLIRETQELRGMIELTEYRLGQLETKLEGEGSITDRVSALETGEPPPTAKPAKRDNPSVIATDVPDEPKKMLAYADGLLKQKKSDEARGVLRQVIRKAPKTPGVTDAAYYKLGKLYYDEKKYRNALQELVKVVEGFERGAYADDAYYRIGLASMDLGNLEDAQIFFNQVLKSYPKSTLVKAARKKLKEVETKLKTERKR
ncbi:MAG: tetratricopeptide repeat protein [Myxococcota bacterium]